jgi:hypothetical protein
MSWSVHFNVVFDLGVLARDGILDVASALSLLLPAADVTTVSEVGLAERTMSGVSGVVHRPKESPSSSG